ncbi:MAG: hypothetical protein M3O32_15410 [Actinomycetota bacterium]|nr:hypothetical protein [Actinomycetota bacterium]
MRTTPAVGLSLLLAISCSANRPLPGDQAILDLCRVTVHPSRTQADLAAIAAPLHAALDKIGKPFTNTAKLKSIYLDSAQLAIDADVFGQSKTSGQVNSALSEADARRIQANAARLRELCR